jgi:hypothetical protein
VKHARPDYQKRFGKDPAVDDPTLLEPGSSAIGYDEPVFLLRAKDKLAPHNLLDYAARAEESGVDSAVVKAARDQARAMQDWQEKNGCKLPDVPVPAAEPKKAVLKK